MAAERLFQCTASRYRPVSARRVVAAWRAHHARLAALTYAGGGVFAAATAGEDGCVKLWGLTKVPADSGNQLGGGSERCVTYCQQLLGQWEAVCTEMLRAGGGHAQAQTLWRASGLPYRAGSGAAPAGGRMRK